MRDSCKNRLSLAYWYENRSISMPEYVKEEIIRKERGGTYQFCIPHVPSPVNSDRIQPNPMGSDGRKLPESDDRKLSDPIVGSRVLRDRNRDRD